MTVGVSKFSLGTAIYEKYQKVKMAHHTLMKNSKDVS